MKIIPAMNTVEQNTIVQEEILHKACEAVIVAIVNSLPRDVQTIEVFEYVLDTSKEHIKRKVIELK